MDRSRVLDRIVKLLKLGGASANTTEHEMMAAITAAKRLMAQYDIHLAEVQAASGAHAETVTFAIHRQVAYTRRMAAFAPYDYCVALAVGHLTTTRALTSRVVRGGATYVSMQFVGTETDAHLASELFTILLSTVRRLTRRALGGGWSGRHTSYAVGMGTRLVDRAKAMVTDLTPTEAQTYALVVASKRTHIDQWMAAHTTDTTRRRMRSLDADAWSQGYAAGGAIDLGVRNRLPPDPETPHGE